MLTMAAPPMMTWRRTYGKGSSQAVVYQQDGYAASFTAYTLAVGRTAGAVSLDGKGVTPHMPWHWRAPRSVRAADDAEIERVLSALGSVATEA